jgi:aryl-alcohol dehydrogenase (NADP+)
MFDTVEKLRPLAHSAGMTMAQMSVAWVLANPAITAPIVGASRPEQLNDAVRAVANPLPDEIKTALDELTAKYRRGDSPR